ncbi:Tat proofreading chaperone DmsD [Escherichia coli]|nr:Tat proofreading chaperone DmsD [Escherichia coli]EJQ5577813.1 Tat proofreading chaperone DmsD [Escherichia coli]
MTHFSQQDNFSVAARVLGALFYYAPESAEAAPLVAVLTRDGWETQWPLPEASLAPLVTAFQTQSEETHAQAWQRLFVGPWALPSPPWGSVWLDRESVLFGDSTLALRQWMREKGIQFEMKQNEPEDHFGSLLLMAAWLAATTHAPIMSTLMICEMTGEYQLLPGLLIACVIASVISRTLHRDSIYRQHTAKHS